MMNAKAPIGVFDSGIGGLSILKALLVALPHERFVYFADSAHNPYGEKNEAFVQERTLAIARDLVEQHKIKALVVACNTATAAAIHLLRAANPELPIVGVEPALRPAALASRTGRIKVLATRGTLHSAKFAQLQKKLEAEYASAGKILYIDTVACDGLAEWIEGLAASKQGVLHTIDLIAARADSMPAIGQFFSKNEPFDTLVLGCTHYPLIRDTFAAHVGSGVQIVDNAMPVALRTAQLVGTMAAPSEQQGSVRWLSSADEAKLVQAARFWGVAHE